MVPAFYLRMLESAIFPREVQPETFSETARP